MRATFMGFEAAKSAVFANQKSIDIVGNNLANLDTKGYTRQRVTRAAVSPSSFSTKVASSRLGLAGQGVVATGVSQMRDSFLDKCFREEYSKSSYHGQAAEILDSLQQALIDGNDLTDESGLQGAIQNIYKSLNDYMKDPTMDTEANIVMSAFKTATQVLQEFDKKLTVVADQQMTELKTSVDRANELMEQIAYLNKVIASDVTVTQNPENEYFRPNELLDRRNLLLDELSAYGDISVTELSNGMVNVSMGGHQVVKEGNYDGLVASPTSQNTLEIKWRSTGENITTKNGIFAAGLHFINGRGNNVQNSNEATQQGILYYRDRINTFASALAQIANSSIPEMDATTGKPQVDADGNIVYKTLLAAKGDDGKTDKRLPVTAGSISISDEWTTKGAGYFIFSKDSDVIDYAQKLSYNLLEGKHTFTSYGETFTGTFAEYQIDMLGRLGSDLAYHEGRQEATAMVADDFLDRRDSISGVNRDEETADMLKFQKSYEAAARMMTTLDDLLDIVINRMGRAGL